MTESEEEKKERIRKALIGAQEQFRIDQKIIEKLTGPYRALKNKLKSVPQKARHNDPRVAQMYREVAKMRKVYFTRRRLPKDHPDRIDGRIPEMEI